MNRQEAIADLASKFPWPQTKPDLPFNGSGWFPDCNQKVLSRYLSEKTTLIIELGSWLGLSTRWILDRAPMATVLAIDHWKGDEAANDQTLVPILYESFISNCWAYKNRLIPIRATTLDGIRYARVRGLNPDLVYVDAGHDYISAQTDIRESMSFGCPLVGDDFNPNTWPGVVRAVWEEANNFGRPMTINGSSWTIERR